MEPKNNVTDLVNNHIRQFIIYSLDSGLDIQTTYRTIEKAAMGFVYNYQKDLEAFPEIQTQHVADIAVRETYSTTQHVCFEQKAYLFTGGAHGYNSISYLHVDPDTGSILETEMLFSDMEALRKIAEKAFRKQNDIGADDSINASGFWFEKDRFQLPETIGFYDDYLMLRFDQYDIVNYVEGPVEIRIPFSEVKTILLK